MSSKRTVLATLLVTGLPLGLGTLFISSGLDDDAYLTFQPAYQLAEFGSLRNVNGDLVESSSSLLFVLLLALLRRLSGVDLATIAPLVSAVAGACAVGLGFLLARRLAPESTPAIARLGPLLASLAAASSSALVLWSWSGMDTTMQAHLACVWVLATGRALRHPDPGRVAAAAAAAATVGYLLVRPEAPFVLLVALVIAWVAADRKARTAATLRRLALPAGWIVIAALALAAWRLNTFGTPVPQPVVAKASGLEPERVKRGLAYAFEHAFLGWQALFWALGLLGTLVLLRRRTSDPTARLLTGFVWAQLLFVVACGGDWMIRGRFLVPIVPLLAAGAFVGAAALLRSRAPVLLALVLACQLLGMLDLARNASPGMPAWARSSFEENPRLAGLSPFERWNRQRVHDAYLIPELRAIIERIHSATGKPVTVLSGQMGMVTHHLARELQGRVRFVDRFGLATRHVTDCPTTADQPRKDIGVLVLYAFFFAHREEIDACGFGSPEVIWDWSDDRMEKLFAREGYVVRYRQDGLVPNASTLFPGREVRGREFVSVRSDLAELFETPTTSFLFP